MSAEPLVSSDTATDTVLVEISDIRIEGRSENAWHPIVRGVSLQVKCGEVLGLIGESGAGKSTLGLAAMGYVRRGCRIAGGRIVFDGVDLTAESESERRRIRRARMGYVAQNAAASFNPAHRLGDQSIEAAVYRGKRSRAEAEADLEQLYAHLRLPGDLRKRYPHQVSGGQLQRAMIAMAIICRPTLVVFDEPTTALDVTTQVQVLTSIRNVLDEFNAAALYISHDLAVVAQMADRIMVLRNGATVEVAPTREMLANPAAEYTRSLWGVRKLAKEERHGDELIMRVRDVDASYAGGPKILEGVSIDIPRARTVAVVGESGSGKSTLARVVAGLLAPSRGEVWFEGRRLPATYAKRTKSDLKRIQLIYQSADTALNPHQRVADLIGRPLKLYLGLDGRDRDRRVAELLAMIELPESYLNRLPRELSGGQKQRVCIARALAAAPDLIICDEVTSALDHIVQEEILTLLIRLQRELGIAYLFITHDIETVRAIADEIVVMFHGAVVEQGLKSRVLSPPHPEYTQRLLSSVPKMDPDWLNRYTSTNPSLCGDDM